MEDASGAPAYSEPLPPTPTRLQRLPRCGGSGREVAAVPLAVFVLLVVVSLAAAAWNVRMALNNAHLAEQLREEAAARCLGALGGSRGGSGIRRVGASSGGLVGSGEPRSDSDEGSRKCMVDAAELLNQASQIGGDFMPTAAPTLSNSSLVDIRSTKASIQANAKTLAHLSSGQYSDNNGMSGCVSHWNSDPMRGFVVSGNISSSCSGLTINASGYYFIYSQVGYDLSVHDSVRVMPSTDHILMRWRATHCASVCARSSSDRTEVLARARKTRCWGKAQIDSVTSSYVGALFRLEKGDVVTLHVDQLRYVSHDSMRTYLGAYFIDGF